MLVKNKEPVSYRTLVNNLNGENNRDSKVERLNNVLKTLRIDNGIFGYTIQNSSPLILKPHIQKEYFFLLVLNLVHYRVNTLRQSSSEIDESKCFIGKLCLSWLNIIIDIDTFVDDIFYLCAHYNTNNMFEATGNNDIDFTRSAKHIFKALDIDNKGYPKVLNPEQMGQFAKGARLNPEQMGQFVKSAGLNSREMGGFAKAIPLNPKEMVEFAKGARLNPEQMGQFAKAIPLNLKQMLEFAQGVGLGPNGMGEFVKGALLNPKEMGEFAQAILLSDQHSRWHFPQAIKDFTLHPMRWFAKPKLNLEQMLKFAQGAGLGPKEMGQFAKAIPINPKEMAQFAQSVRINSKEMGEFAQGAGLSLKEMLEFAQGVGINSKEMLEFAQGAGLNPQQMGQFAQGAGLNFKQMREFVKGARLNPEQMVEFARYNVLDDYDKIKFFYSQFPLSQDLTSGIPDVICIELRPILEKINISTFINDITQEGIAEDQYQCAIAIDWLLFVIDKNTRVFATRPVQVDTAKKVSNPTIVVGDADGSHVRLVVAGLQAGIIKLKTLEASTALLKLIKHEANFNDTLSSWQKSKDVKELLTCLANGIEQINIGQVQIAKTSRLVFIGDIIYDRFNNNPPEEMKIRKILYDAGAIFIRGNHDIDMPPREQNDNFNDMWGMNTRVSRTTGGDDAKFVNCYWDSDNKILYLHNGLRIYYDEHYYVRTAFGVFKLDEFENMTSLVTVLNSQQNPDRSKFTDFRVITKPNPGDCTIDQIAHQLFDGIKIIEGHDGMFTGKFKNNELTTNPRGLDNKVIILRLT